MSTSSSLILWKLAFQISPIFFNGGVANQIAGGTLPIIYFTEAVNQFLALVSGNDNVELDDFFAHYQPLPGSTLHNLEVGMYPFANQTVAANATIKQPLQLSMLMRCPTRNTLGYYNKIRQMMILQQAVDTHASWGGTYTVLSPAFYYTNGICTAIRDVSDTESHQPQNAYQWDFTFPLLTTQQAQSAQNNLMSQLTNQTQISGQPAWSGLSSSVGNSNSLASSSVVSSASSVPATAPASSTS